MDQMFTAFLPDCIAVVTTDGTDVAYGPFFSTGTVSNVHDFLDGVAAQVDAGLRPVTTRARIIELDTEAVA